MPRRASASSPARAGPEVGIGGEAALELDARRAGETEVEEGPAQLARAARSSGRTARQRIERDARRAELAAGAIVGALEAVGPRSDQRRRLDSRPQAFDGRGELARAARLQRGDLGRAHEVEQSGFGIVLLLAPARALEVVGGEQSARQAESRRALEDLGELRDRVLVPALARQIDEVGAPGVGGVDRETVDEERAADDLDRLVAVQPFAAHARATR